MPPDPPDESDGVYRVLGPVEVEVRGTTFRPSSVRQQIVLAVLAVRSPRVVPVPELVDAVWGERPPTTARSQIQICISHLRRDLRDVLGVAPIRTRPTGYVLVVERGWVDATVFEAAVESARGAEPEQTAAELRDALALWRGPALGEARALLLAQALEEKRVTALEYRYEAELRAGRHADVVAELRAACAEHPLREQLRAHLMVALAETGRAAEALEVYRDTRQLVITELGIEPSSRLRELEAAILTGELGPVVPNAADTDAMRPDAGSGAAPPPGPDAGSEDEEDLEHLRSTGDPEGADPRSRIPSPPSGEYVVPRQAPAETVALLGREASLDQVRALLTTPPADGVTSPMVGIVGGGGVGKTSLAIRVAHELVDAFPDGQLFARLGAHGAGTVGPAEVLRRFVRALGWRKSVPTTQAELEALYRSLSHDRRLLVILDDVDAESVLRALTPGGERAALLFTARAGLVGAPFTRLVRLGRLPAADSDRLLRLLVGGRADLEPGAVADLVDMADGWPLALRVIGARLAARPHRSIASLVARLRDERHRLDELAVGDLHIRSVLGVSYSAVSDRARRLVRLATADDYADLPGWTAAALLDEDGRLAEDALDELVEEGLVEVAVDEGPDLAARFRLHDLVRAYGAEQRRAAEDDDVAAAARVIGGYVALAAEAHRALHGGDFAVIRDDLPAWRPDPRTCAEVAAAPLAWFEDERANLLAAIDRAAAAGWSSMCWRLALFAVTLFERTGDVADWTRSHETALAVTRARDDRRGEAALLCSLGSQDPADPERLAGLHRALALFEEQSDHVGRALTLRNLGRGARHRGDWAAAERYHEQAVSGFRTAGDRVSEAHTLISLALGHLEDGDLDSAMEKLVVSRDIASEIGATRIRAQAAFAVGETWLRRGDAVESTAAFEEALDLIAGQDAVGELLTRCGAASAALQIDDIDLSGRHLDAADRLREATTNLLGHGRYHLVRGCWHVRRGDHRAAREALAEAVTHFEGRDVFWHGRAVEALERLASPG